MNIVEIIEKKRDKKALTKAEINYFVKEYTKGNIPDYQASALLMAIYLNGLNKDEIYELTISMKNSGKTMNFSRQDLIFADKHSTGGVGDKTTFLVLPLVSCCGIFMPKLSGRGLGFTGGTADKIESVPGFRANLDFGEFENLLYKNGAVLATQTNNLTPADKKIYALRDVTGTVSSLPLIASSIMSKKLAINSNIICLDIKCGSGAFMKTFKEAEELANLMIEIGNSANRKMCAVISDMSQPLGNAVGNSLEVYEALSALKTGKPYDLIKLSKTIAELILKKAGIENAGEIVLEKLRNGEAYQKLCDIISSQGGDMDAVLSRDFKRAKFQKVIYSKQKGYIESINCELIGKASLYLGAGRMKLGDEIDHKAGIYLYKKVGDFADVDDKLFELYTSSEERLIEAEKMALKAYKFSSKMPEKRDVILKIIE
ncbi:MAG: thymidine phosphorylase [Clostridiaceae bacterium]|nr:thymidine phosphorylase [Clostridiaceae bacterium]